MSDTKSTLMTKEEEEEMEAMMRQRRAGRSSAFYGGPPPLCRNPNVTEGDGLTRSSGLSEPNSTKEPEGRVMRHSMRLRIGFADTIGKRPSMEDEIMIVGKLRNRDEEDYVAIFDGHGGKSASEFAAKHLHHILEEKLSEYSNPAESLKQAFLTIQEKMRVENVNGGTTAIVALFMQSKCYIANAGDCRAVLMKNNKVTRMSEDHKPDLPSESERIEKAGGMVTKTTSKQGKVISRVNGMLAVSRALGDLFLHPFVSAEPEVKEFEFSEDAEQLLILACDGLWDVVSDEEAVSIAKAENNPEQSAIKLREAGLSKYSNDNISVVVIRPKTSSQFSSDQTKTNSSLARNNTLALLAAGVVVALGVWSYLR